MPKKYKIFLLLGMLFMSVPALFASEDNFGFENWPGKNGEIKANVEFPVDPFLGYGITIRSDIIPQQLWLDLKITPTLYYGDIKIIVCPTIEEAQNDMLDTFQHGFSGNIRPKQLLNSPIGDVVFGLDNTKFRLLYFTRANVMVQIMLILTSTKAYDELPGKIDAIIQNAPAWKQGNPEPRLIISDDFKKAFSSLTTVVDKDLPQVFTLSQNTPNPFNPSTAIAFTLSRPERMRLTVYDVLGREIAILAQGSYPAGSHTVRWNGRDGRGNAVSSGVYLYRLEASGKKESRKMLLAK